MTAIHAPFEYAGAARSPPRRSPRCACTRRRRPIPPTVDLEAAVPLLTRVRPRVGELVLARVAVIGQHKAIELAHSRRASWQAKVGNGGSPLSAGERARVLLGRTALGDPKLLILDEAETHLDASAADLVDQALAEHGGTALVVTHRRELVGRADLVWCLQDGRVVEVGPPETVLCGDGPTARLLNAETPMPQSH